MKPRKRITARRREKSRKKLSTNRRLALQQLEKLGFGCKLSIIRGVKNDWVEHGVKWYAELDDGRQLLSFVPLRLLARRPERVEVHEKENQQVHVLPKQSGAVDAASYRRQGELSRGGDSFLRYKDPLQRLREGKT